MDEKHPKRPRDLNQWAKRMVDIATGASEDQRGPRAKLSKVEAARLGGKKRATVLTKAKKAQIAKKAARSRWLAPAKD
jgi:hypothetical protein